MNRMKWLSVALVILAITLGITLFAKARANRFDPNDPDRAGVIRRAITRDKDVAREASLASLNHEDPDVRMTALAALGIVGNPADIPLIDNAARNDASSAVRSQACRALVRYDTEESVATVCELAIDAESAYVRRGALRALAGTDQPIARVTQVGVMDYALTDGDRQAAADGMQRNLKILITPDINDPEGWAIFLEAIKHSTQVEAAFDEFGKPLVGDPAIWEAIRLEHERLTHENDAADAAHEAAHEADEPAQGD
mgnify:CR=1 FL=1